LRANPADASYCFYDGVVLGGSRGSGPVSVGSQPFARPFVFPTGRQCRNFDELAVACQNEWSAARDLLQQGFLESFFGGLGRSDLALAARESARFPDRDRGLDQLLGKLPGQAIEPPKLFVSPQEVSLGTLRVGQDQRCELHFENRGMRLLYGSVTCDGCDWLTVGDAPGSPEKLFQFGHETTIPVHVAGKRLRAGNRPLEGRLTVDSNGGQITVIVRADVPVKPYPDGILKGATTPRIIAEKAKASPKESAAYFEKGAVAKWYQDNGWIYPVQGPSASGLGAVQQFFEALGLTPPPKVDVSQKSIQLTGNVGDQLKHAIEVSSQEKRPVYAHATSGAAWLEVGRPKLNGRVATIPLVVPAIPDREGETLKTNVTVQANGNQRFVIPVTLVVGGNLNFGAPAVVPIVDAVEEVKPIAPATAKTTDSRKAPIAAVKSELALEPVRRGSKQASGGPIHLLPLALLLLVLFGVLVYDAFKSRTGDTQNPLVQSTERGAGGVNLGLIKPISPEPHLAIEHHPWEQFGVQMLLEPDPDHPGKFRTAADPKYPDKRKRLTFDEHGESNNTCLKIDGFEYLFGDPQAGQFTPRGKDSKDKNKHIQLKDAEGKPRQAWESEYIWTKQDIVARQTVELVVSEQTRLYDTVLVRYSVKNKSESTPHTVGLRFMLDTFIGANDGVPFAIPGRPGLLDTMETFDQKDIPQYIEALEYPDPKKPGTVARVGLKLGDRFEPIEKMLICRWPGNNKIRWEIQPYESMQPKKDDPNSKGDSCVVLYWGYLQMNAGETREFAFTYGLGSISSVAGESGGDSGTLGISVGGDFRRGKEFTATVYVGKPTAGQEVKLELQP
jgi:hypothetical protein